MMGKSAFFSEGTAGQMKSAPSFAKDDDSTLPKEPNGSKIRLGPKPIWGMSGKPDEHLLLVSALAELGPTRSVLHHRLPRSRPSNSQSISWVPSQKIRVLVGHLCRLLLLRRETPANPALRRIRRICQNLTCHPLHP